jgi:hypothetical protein
MTEFLAYKEVNEAQYAALEGAATADEVKALLVDTMGVSYPDERKQRIACDLYFYCYAFCKEHAFDGRKTTTFLSMMKQVFQRDTEGDFGTNRTLSNSYEWFEEVLLRHCVERAPSSVQVFEDHEVGPILDFAVDTYFRQYRMYRYIFGVQARVKIQMLLPQSVEIPASTFLPLTSGVMKGE